MTIVTDPQALLAEQAAEVVGKLTEAQKRALLDVQEPTAFATRWFSRMHGSTHSALYRLGLADYDAAPCRITPLGLACRAILIERQGK